jgi:rubrerythrin
VTREGNLNAFKTGIKPDYYRRIAFEAYGESCNRCGATELIVVHHRDENRHNNHVTNLEVLCRTCHMKEHHGKRVEWTCPECGTVLSLQPFWAQRRKFCSNQCRLNARNADGTFGKVAA